MISVKQASQLMLAQHKDWGKEAIPLATALGRVLAEDVRADRDFPPYDRVTMDGIAYAWKAFAAGKRKFVVQATQLAGEPRLSLKSPSHCIEIMTGAVLPLGCDTVSRVEEVVFEQDKGKTLAFLEKEQPKQGQNIHTQGLDYPQGKVLLSKNTLIRSAEVAVLASVGKATVWVKKLPKVAIIATGTELVPIEQTPLPYQVRRSNTEMLAAILATQGLKADLFHFSDEKKQLQTAFEDLTKQYDILLISGGVSKGKADFVPEIMENLGIQKHFHRVAQRPGKPFWFGSNPNTLVFALPGNPVSAFTCAYRYVLPFLFPEKKQTTYAELSQTVHFKPNLTYFLPVSLENKNGKVLATPHKGNGSGDFVNLLQADALLQLPAQKTVFEKGEVYPYYFCG